MLDTERLQLLKQLYNQCPLGWHQGKILKLHSTTDQDVIQWLCDLGNLIGVDEHGTPEAVAEIQTRRTLRKP